MAVEFGDHSSGFRHTEVVKFINNEVLMNGGGPEFYMTFRSRSWNEIEDQLHTILVDPKVSRSLKRACTWSALALSVRVAARQRAQQARRVWRLQDQVGERESASWTLISELQRLREERDQAAAQLLSTQIALQEAMDEREVLRGRLLQAERSALAVVLEPRMEHSRAPLWSFEEEGLEKLEFRESQNMSHLEAQMPILSCCMPGFPSPWVQEVQPFLRMPVPHPLPLNAPFSLGFPYSPPVPCPVLMNSKATAAAMATGLPQIAPPGIYPPGLWLTLESQETIAPAWNQICSRQNECSEILQDVRHLADSVSHSEEEDPEKPPETSLHGDSSNNSHKEKHAILQMMAATEKKYLGMHLKTAAVEDKSNHSIKEESVMPQGIAAQGNKTSSTQKKCSGISRRVAGLKESISHTKCVSVTSQEADTQVNKTTSTLKKYSRILLRKPDLGNIVSYNQKDDTKALQRATDLGKGTRNCQKEDTFQQKTRLAAGGSPKEKKMPQKTGKSQSQKEEPNRFQVNNLGKCKSYFMNKCPKNQLAPKQKVKQPQGMKVLESKQPQGIKSFESKQQEKPLSHCSSVNSVCPSWKTGNHSWCKGCYKCAKSSA